MEAVARLYFSCPQKSRIPFRSFDLECGIYDSLPRLFALTKVVLDIIREWLYLIENKFHRKAGPWVSGAAATLQTETGPESRSRRVTVRPMRSPREIEMSMSD